MMFGLIKNLLGEALGIAMVILAVVLFSFFDPFGWFTSSPKLKGTSILVREVKEIQQLISAEYYGEAITSWKVSRQEDRFEADKENIENILENIAFDLQELDEKEHGKNPSNIGQWKRKAVWRKYKRKFRDRYENTGVYPFIVKELGAGKEEDLIYLIYQDKVNLTDTIVKKISAAYDLSMVQKNRKERKKDLIAIGRGIVRAGIDLSNMTKEDIVIDEFRKTVLIRNAELKIFPVEMNPWFIPQRGVKGFEVLRLKGSVDINNVKIVKSNLKNQLREQAIDRKILDQAKENAEESLAGFFNLLDDQIEQVRLLHDPIDLIEFEITKIRQSKSQSFSPSHANFIFNSLLEYANEYDSPQDIERTQSAIESLGKLKIDVVYKVKEQQEEIKLDTVKWQFDAYNVMAIKSVYKYAPPLDSTKINPVYNDTTFIEAFWLKSESLNSETLDQKVAELKNLIQESN